MSKESTTPSHLIELNAMKKLARLLDAIPADVRARVLDWAQRAYGNQQTGGK